MISLLRHADAARQARDAPLSPAGHAAAAALIPELTALDTGRVFSSPCARAQQTISPVAKAAGLPVLKDTRLREREHGAVSAGAWDREAEALFADPSAQPYGGESVEDVAQWGLAAISEIERQQSVPLIATHGLWFSVVLSRFGRPLTIEAWRAMARTALFAVENGHFSQVELAA
ncbi:MAG: histidine phosphatase family protein [Pseudomonadota bacterium]